MFQRRRKGKDFSEEIQSHIILETDRLIRDGMNPEKAASEARRRFGNVTAAQERFHESGRSLWLDRITQDCAYAFRSMRMNPVFTLTAVLTLALGIGANTAMFTVVHGVLLKPLEYRDPDRLVRISGGSTVLRFEEMRAAAQSFSDVAIFLGQIGNLTLSGDAEPEVLRQSQVSANFLRVLGVEPFLGRSFLAEEDRSDAPPVVMISAELWQRRFGGDPLIAGKTAILSAKSRTIVGVLPPHFQFPAPDIDVWSPLALPADATNPSAGSVYFSPVFTVIGRLKPLVDLESAAVEFSVFDRQYADAHPAMLDAKPKSPARLTLWKDELVANIRSTIWMLFGAVGFVLLIACANVAGLLLARASSREREFALRAALGAGRSRLFQQQLTESVLLATLGSALGMLVGQWGLNGISGMSAFNLPRAAEIHMDGTVLGFTILMSLVTGLLFGIAPSLRGSRPDPWVALRTSNSGGSLRGFNARNFLVIGQVALSIVLLIGASLLMRSLFRAYGIDPGFNPANVLTMRISLSGSRYDTNPKRVAFTDELVHHVESLPGVRSAAITLTLPMTGFVGTPVHLVGRPLLRLNERPIAILQSVTSDYFRTFEIPLRRGRSFTSQDGTSPQPLVMINESLARLFWPEYPNGQDPIGQRLLIGATNPDPAEIIGIAADVPPGLGTDNRPGIFRVYGQNPFPALSFAVRTDTDPKRFSNAVRQAVLAIDHDQPVSSVKTMDDIVADSLGQRRMVMTLLATFAGVAALLTLIGIYGVIAYSVMQRTREVGVRLALGAHPRNILGLLLRQGLGISLAGSALGLIGAFALTGVLKSFLFEVSPTDPATFAGVTLTFLAVALAASYIPIRRATRIDPAIVLRHE